MAGFEAREKEDNLGKPYFLFEFLQLMTNICILVYICICYLNLFFNIDFAGILNFFG